jgi:acetyltransferase-like isoleucine patch superfamily enzyme
VDVGDGAWIGAGAKILDGVTIGERAIVGAAAGSRKVPRSRLRSAFRPCGSHRG